MTRTLSVWWDGVVVGTLQVNQHGQMRFTYASDWLADASRPAISFSLPKREQPFTQRQCRPFFAGLLPEEAQREVIAGAIGISKGNDFAFLEALGGDVAGALSLWPEGEVPPAPDPTGTPRPLTDDELVDVLDTLPKRPLLAGPYNERNAEHSPDGRFLAFVSDESGRSEVYVARYPSLEGRSAVSLEGGTNPRWSRDGRELFFRQGDAVMAASVDSRGGARVERPRRLFAGSYDGEGRHGSFDVAADGRRFVMVEDDEASALRELTLVQGFFEELRRLAPPAPGAVQ